MFKRLWRSKTFWFCVSGIVTALGAAATGEITWPQAVSAVFAGLMGIGFRDKMEKMGFDTPLPERARTRMDVNP